MDSEDRLILGIVMAWVLLIGLAVVCAVVNSRGRDAAFITCVQAGSKPAECKGAMP